METDHLIFIGRPLEHVSGPLDVQQDVCEDSNGVLIASHHQVGEPDIVVGGDLALGHTRVHTLRHRTTRVRQCGEQRSHLSEINLSEAITHLLVEFNVLQDFDGLVVVAQQGVKPQEPNQAKVTQHFVERVTTILPSHALWVT